MKKYIFALVLLAVLTPALAAAEPLNVFVSVVPQEYFLDKIGRGKVKVTVMVPPGANPAVYEPKPSQMMELAKTDLYFAIGVPYETAWLPKIQASNPRMTIIHTDANVPQIPIDDHTHEDEDGNIIEHDHEGEVMDPHIWLDPQLVKIQARNIADALKTADPENADFYEANYETFLVQIDDLDSQLRKTLEPYKGITFITFHPAWGYFAKAYGLNQMTVEVGGREPSPAQLKEIIQAGKDAKVKVVFVQPQFDQKHAKTIAKQIRAKLMLADPLALDWFLGLKQQALRIERMY